VDAYIAQFTGERDENGRRLVVRNGSIRAGVLTSAGGAGDRARVNDKRTDRARVSGSGSPRRSCRRGAGRPEDHEVLPLLYLHGLSSGTSCPPRPVPRSSRACHQR